jgi:hypothetical protein
MISTPGDRQLSVNQVLSRQSSRARGRRTEWGNGISSSKDECTGAGGVCIATVFTAAGFVVTGLIGIAVVVAAGFVGGVLIGIPARGNSGGRVT